MRQPVPFGKYLLLDRISVGGMAEVFKAKSYGVEGFEKVIAIKRILPSMGEDEDFINMFIDEAKIAGQLSHANICQIFELGKIKGSHFIAMEYIWGKDLLQIQNRAKRRKVRVPVLMACYIIAKACEGLHYAHNKRDPMGVPMEIVHRDCSPQNILVSYEGEVKVIDFGIARAASRSARTQAGVLKGKFGYMSPEQVRGLPLDRRSDIFSLGTVLYETLTGERLFVGESDFSTLEKVRNADVAPPSKLNPNVPAEVERIVMRALHRDRDERYQWCAEMQADLQAYLTQQEEVVSNKGLGEAVRSLFVAERNREKEQLERYKRVGRDGLISGVPQAEAALEVDEELGEAPPLEGDPTVLGGPDFAAMFPDAAEARTILEEAGGGTSREDGGITDGTDGIDGSRAGNVDSARYNSDFEDKPTAIFAEDDERIGAFVSAAGGGVSPIAGRLEGARGEAASAVARVEVAGGAGGPTLSGRTGAVGGVSPVAGSPKPPHSHSGISAPDAYPQQPVPISRSAAPSQSAAAPSQQVAYPSQNFHRPAQMVAITGSRRRDRNYAVRDIAIGVGIAAVVLTIFAVGRMLLSGDDGEQVQAESEGTIEVALAGAADAEVSVDDVVVGQVTTERPLVLAAAVGAHKVVVKAAGATPCERVVAVTEGKRVPVSCKMPSSGNGGEPTPEGAPDASSASIDAGVASAETIELVDGGAAVGDGGASDSKLAAAQSKARDDEPEQDKLAKDKLAKDKLAKDKLAKDKLAKEKRAKDKLAKEKRAKEKRDKEIAAARGKDNEKPDDTVGYLVANSSPFARVIVDGRNTGKMTPMGTAEKISLSPGRHSVKFVVGSQQFKYSVTIKAGETKRFYRQLPVEKTAPKADDEEDDEED